jgi:hypothetical protein
MTFITRIASLLFPSYRPERHYMRGPGPMWHAKHCASAVYGDAAFVPALVRVPARSREIMRRDRQSS